MMNARFVTIIAVIFVAVILFTVKPAEYYHVNHPVLDEIRRRFAMISPRFAKIPLKTGRESYTENKSVITLCIKNPQTGLDYDMNTLTYVALHELAHCVTKADGVDSHKSEFRYNFAILLQKAENLGIYDPRKPIPPTYCGMKS
jgi:hypothetical protein